MAALIFDPFNGNNDVSAVGDDAQGICIGEEEMIGSAVSDGLEHGQSIGQSGRMIGNNNTRTRTGQVRQASNCDSRINMARYALKGIMSRERLDRIRKKYCRIIGEHTIEQGLNRLEQARPRHKFGCPFSNKFFDNMHKTLLTKLASDSKGLSMTKPICVLFLCTGNSARSILSEALLNDLGQGRFLAWSAGSKPSGVPHPDGLAELEKRGHATQLYRSKSWDEFSKDGAPEFDIVVTVCSNAAAEVCPVFFGPGLKVHWPQPDPAHIEPLSARQAAFAKTYKICKARIEALLTLSETELLDQALVQAIADIDPT